MAQEQFDEKEDFGEDWANLIANMPTSNTENKGISLDPNNVYYNIAKDLYGAFTQKPTAGEVPSMAPMYDTSGYRALDIIGAGIAKRPTQEAYFNRLEAMQNERLQDEYNRRTDTPEAKNLQDLMKETFPNLGESTINKISPDYVAKNYPMLAQIAESRSGAIARKENDQMARENWKALYPNASEAEINTINSKNFDARLAAEDKKAFEREKRETDLQNRKELIMLTKSLTPKKEKDGEKGSDKVFRKNILEHFDAIAQLESAGNFVNKLNRSFTGSMIPDITYTTKATAATIDALAQPQIKALAGPGAITDTERAMFKPLVITSNDPKELALKKFNNLMSNSLSNGIKQLEIAYQTGAVNDNDYAAYMKRYADLQKKYKVPIQK